MSNLPPIVLRAKGLDVLHQLHDEARKRRKTQDQPATYENMELWEREARRRFGPNKLGWKWRCHHCGTVFSAADYLVAQAPPAQVGYACLGVWEPRVACTFNGQHPLPANPITVHMGHVTARMLAFAD